MGSDSPSVLVVGGGTVGLSAAMFLAFQGVRTVLVERHIGIPLHPRAVGWTPRTMELFRTVGVAELIPQKPAGGGPPGRIRVESLAGQWFEESSWTPEKTQGGAAPQARPSIEYSPYGNAGLPQDQLEPILRDKAAELGADIRFATELVSFEQDAEGVTALLRKQDGSEYFVRAAYLIAADGNRSPIREALRIGRQGRGFLQTARSVMFRPSVDKELLAKVEALRARGVVQFAVDQPDLKGMLAGGSDGRWILYFSDDEERDEATLKRVVNQAMGNPHDDPEIITTGLWWEMSARIADTFASGRIFLVGDAAHTLPPNRGGYGANTGIEDAHNLAWKLAAVLSGTSLPRLLETYDDERRPIAWLRHQQIFNRPDYAAYADKSTKAPIIDDVAMDLGQLYRSAAVLGVSDELPPALRPDQWAGQPGTRAPHLWLTKDGERISTLDLFQRDWVLLTEDQRWRDAADQAGACLGVKLDCQHIGVDLVAASPEAFRTGFGTGPTGASLVRPDGYIAWRSMDLPVDATRVLTDVVQHVAAAARPYGGADMSGATLEARIQKLEDIEAIKDLMARYARNVDKGWDNKTVEVDKLSEIFAEDIEWEVVGMNLRGSGLQNLMEEVAEQTAAADFTMHGFTNPILTVDGDEATGNWLLWIIGKGGDAARQSFHNAELTYRRTVHGWRIQTGCLHFGTSIKSHDERRD